ncbi:MAG: hypothetical protein ACEQSA_01385 [Weeksellaceae bacterium]
MITVDDILRAKDQQAEAAMARKLAEEFAAAAARLEQEAHDTLELAKAQMGDAEVETILAQAEALMPVAEQKISVIITADVLVTEDQGLVGRTPLGGNSYLLFGQNQSGQGNETS